MRVLQVNKFFYPRGGTERYFFDVSCALADAGHDVVHFAMAHPENGESAYADGFVSHVDFHASGSPLDLLRRAARFVYSGEARDRLAELIKRTRPDVAHLHNVAHQLTPSILDALQSANVPVVQTLHDYKLICSSYLLFADGKVCERCRGGRHYQAALRRCHHGSISKSALGVVEMTVHALRGSYRSVRRFLCPSRFLRDKHREFGVAGDRLAHVPYFIRGDRYTPAFEPGEYALYLGRLSREKGVATLLDAAERVRLPLVVLGGGPLRVELERRAAEAGVPVEFLGHLEGESLHDAIRAAAFVVVPSEWYENLPYAVLESFALGKPVLGARMGGIPELVREGETGALFTAGHAGELAEAWRRLCAEPERLESMGRRARGVIDRDHSPGAHIEQLTEVYRSVAS